MEASHKTHRPHMKVGKDEEKKKKKKMMMMMMMTMMMMMMTLGRIILPFLQMTLKLHTIIYSMEDMLCFLLNHLLISIR